jgi:hypothetical protein
VTRPPKPPKRLKALQSINRQSIEASTIALV